MRGDADAVLGEALLIAEGERAEFPGLAALGDALVARPGLRRPGGRALRARSAAERRLRGSVSLPTLPDIGAKPTSSTLDGSGRGHLSSSRAGTWLSAAPEAPTTAPEVYASQKQRQFTYGVGFFDDETVSVPEFTGVREVEIPLDELRELIDWSPFFHAWELRGVYPRILDDPKYGDGVWITVSIDRRPYTPGQRGHLNCKAFL